MPQLPASEPGNVPLGISPLFVCDSSAEGEMLVRSLGAVGYDVFGVPLSLLVNRVEVQKPAAIIIDVDAPAALGCAQLVRDIPGSKSIHVLFTGHPGRTLTTDEDAAFYEGSAFFPRPVNSADVLERVELLVGAPQARYGAASSVSSVSRPSSLSPSASHASMPSMSSPGDSLAAGTGGPSSLPVPRSAESMAAQLGESPALSLPPVPTFGGRENAEQAGWGVDSPRVEPSPELTELLDAADQRLAACGVGPSRPPPPKGAPAEQLEAILTAEVLASLDEPLDLDDDPPDGESVVWGTRAGTEDGRTATGFGTQSLDHGRHPKGATPTESVKDSGESRSGDSALGTDALTPAPPLPIREAFKADRFAGVPPLPTPIPEHANGDSIPPFLPEDATPTPPPLPASAAKRRRTEPPRSAPQSGNPEPYLSAAAPDAPTLPPKPHSPFDPEEPSTRSPGRAAATDGREPRLQRWSQATALRSAESAAPSRRSFGPLGTTSGTYLEPDSSPPSARSLIPSAPPDSAHARTPKIPESLGRGDAVRAVALSVSSRYTGALAFEDSAGIRRVVFSDGDFVTAASGIDGESLVDFLVNRGDLSADVLSLGRKLPQFGRHAGAALIAHGHLRQEDLWPVLRAHAEWLLGRCLQIQRGAANLERTLAARLATEPEVFGGSAGAEVFVEVIRRVISPEAALQRVQGIDARISKTGDVELLDECGLIAEEREVIIKGADDTVGNLIARAGSADFASVLYALHELGVIEASRHAANSSPATGRSIPESDALDDDAIRARIFRRRALVDEGDYFSLLGLSSEATSYDIKRAYSNLRKELDPGGILTARTADLRESLDLILEVLEEAYEILRDDVRRERYRRALLAAPHPS